MRPSRDPPDSANDARPTLLDGILGRHADRPAAPRRSALPRYIQPGTPAGPQQLPLALQPQQPQQQPQQQQQQQQRPTTTGLPSTFQGPAPAAFSMQPRPSSTTFVPPPPAAAAAATGVQPGVTGATTAASSSSFPGASQAPPPPPHVLLVSRRQEGNPVLAAIRNVRWQYADIAPDYQLGQYAAALFLSLRYHLLHPDYVLHRLKQVQRAYRLVVLLVHVDVEEVVAPLAEITKAAINCDATLVCACSTLECARYLETFKAYEHKPAGSIQDRCDTDFMGRLTAALTAVRGVNRADAATLASRFDSIGALFKATPAQLAACPGLGGVKVARLVEAFQQPFRGTAAPAPEPHGAQEAGDGGGGAGAAAAAAPHAVGGVACVAGGVLRPASAVGAEALGAAAAAAEAGEEGCDGAPPAVTAAGAGTGQQQEQQEQQEQQGEAFLLRLTQHMPPADDDPDDPDCEEYEEFP